VRSNLAFGAVVDLSGVARSPRSRAPTAFFTQSGRRRSADLKVASHPSEPYAPHMNGASYSVRCVQGTRPAGHPRLCLPMPDTPATIAEAAEWRRDGRITSVRLTRILLERSYATQDSVTAFITITDEAAVAAAEPADAEFSRGVDRGPLQDTPLAIKDIIATADAPTTANSNVLDPACGNRDDATVVRKLREVGAVITGKLGPAEFACGGWCSTICGSCSVRSMRLSCRRPPSAR
jgi:hypothetical protein